MAKKWPPGCGRGALNAARRLRELQELADGAEIDLLVIGGGITGAGIALDAASRGLRVALVDRHDLAYGTSRFSSKLVHGGLRHLTDGDLGIARESARERRILMTRVAPHLVNAHPQMLPLLPGTTLRQRTAVRMGFLVNDLLRMLSRTSDDVLPRSRWIHTREVLTLAPAIQPNGLRGGLVSWDGQLADDARLVISLARTAATFGARILTRVSAHEVTGGSAILRDELSGEAFFTRPRAVVNATGVWAGDIDSTIRLRPTRGMHLILDGAVFGGLRASVIVPVPGASGRFVFALPAQLGRVYVGVTDDPHQGASAERPAEEEVDFILNTMSSVLARPLTKEHVLGVFTGLRTLFDTADTERTGDLGRKHVVQISDSGVVTVIGGKFTTYRKTAEDAVDTLLTYSSALEALEVGPSKTRGLALLGAATTAQLARVPAPPQLVARYGVEAVDIMELAGGDPRQLEPIAEGIDVCPAELYFAVHAEGALSVDDLLDRRTRIGLVRSDRERALPAAEQALDTAWH
jgi:glycerol-3-phosphate dehydrogenase